MLDGLAKAAEIDARGLDRLPDEVLTEGQPVILRAAVENWPIVQAAVTSDEDAIRYLERFCNSQPVKTVVAAPNQRGRLFYMPDSKKLNYRESPQLLSNVLKGILQQQKSDHPIAVAMQAISAAECLPGLEDENSSPLIPEGTPARVWIGNSVTVAPHFDVADNLACVIAGRRRFILFPPEQTANLYPGPMDVTPANVPISMVSVDDPDLERFPKYRRALEAAVVAELGPGDVLYIPYMWWHGVQSLESFNILMNYWWNRDALSARHPYGALLHLAYLLYGHMPARDRQAWRALYDHYIFQAQGDPLEALMPAHRYSPPEIDPERIAELKQMLRDLLISTTEPSLRNE